MNCDQAVYHLFSKNTHKEFSYGSMAAMLVIYFVMACWSAGTYISSGLVVPMLLIGGLYGRMVGVLFVDLFGIQGRHTDRGRHFERERERAVIANLVKGEGPNNLDLRLGVMCTILPKNL